MASYAAVLHLSLLSCVKLRLAYSCLQSSVEVLADLNG
jgi:hypothetical protein